MFAASEAVNMNNLKKHKVFNKREDFILLCTPTLDLCIERSRQLEVVDISMVYISVEFVFK